METMLLRLYQQQVLLQCEFALNAFKDINKGLVERDITQAFCGIQNFLNATANISKALWGSGGRKESERKALRDSIGVSDGSPLREVNMRNNFEHFDERLDRWWKDSSQHIYVDLNVGAKSAILSGAEEIDIFRLYDPKTKDLMFWGEQFNIQAIVKEIQRILPKLKAEAKKPPWE